MKLHYSEGMKLHGDNACKYLGFEKYDWKTDRDKPTMFWIYNEDDYLKLANHSGKKYVCWHGSDVRHFANNFAGKFVNIIRNTEITHICLNHILQAELGQMGIHADLKYIFWGDTSKYTLQKEFTKDAYMCANKGRGPEYGELLVNTLAWVFKDWNFHIFGIEPTVQTYCDNVKYYGWIEEDDMDRITKNFGLCLRLNQHDGFPQIICKALLRGQEVITRLPYDGLTVFIQNYEGLLTAFGEYDDRMNGIKDEAGERPDIRLMINNFDFNERKGL